MGIMNNVYVLLIIVSLAVVPWGSGAFAEEGMAFEANQGGTCIHIATLD